MKVLGVVLLTAIAGIYSYFYLEECCATKVEICATVDGTNCLGHDTALQSDVYICPGESVDLWWAGSNDVTSASITPGVGSVSPQGNTTVTPTADTEYKIEARGQCTAVDRVNVHVIEEGDLIKLIAIPVAQAELWRVNYPATSASRRIKVTQIMPVCGLNCVMHAPPIANYPYLNCGSTAMCNGLWNGEKEDLNGTLTGFNTLFDASIGGFKPTPLSSIPLAGTWRFRPGSYHNLTFTKFAYFEVRGYCE